jgi:AraC-like DNA-binding protein
MRGGSHTQDGDIGVTTTPAGGDVSPRAGAGVEPRLPPPTIIRSAGLAAFVEAARSVGLDPHRMMRDCGIPRAAESDPELPMSSGCARGLLATSALASGREDFGLLVGDAFTLAMMGPVGLLMRSQPTVRAAFEAFSRYAGYLNDTISIHLEEYDGGMIVIPIVAGPARAAPRTIIDALMGQMLQFLRTLAPAGGRPEWACFSYPEPNETAPYRRRFGRVEFDQDFNGLAISRADLGRRLSTADPEAARTLARIVEGAGSAVAESMVDRVSALIERLLPAGDCSAKRAAQMLGIDRRTIYRRLAQEGETFSSLVDRMRRDLAAELLSHGGRSISQVADLLGFSSLSTFSRWFHRSHGTSARDFRKAA